MTIFKQLLDIQKELPKIDKDGVNPHHKNTYATLPQILSKVLPVLHKHNFILSAVELEKGGAEYLEVKLVNAETGEGLNTFVKLINITDMQKLGSAYTYALRYGLLALLGISPDIDDDGNNAAGVAAITKPAKEPTFEEIVKLYNKKKDKLPTAWIEPLETHIANKDMPKLIKAYEEIKKK